MEKIKLSPKVLNSFSGQDLFYSNQKIAKFLNTHLDEFGDSVEDILKCLDYVFEKNLGNGGFVLLGIQDQEIIGAVVINETGMSKYIPENILVYIAVHKDYRGKGLGKQLMEHALKLTKGDVALHVEPDNPAKKLYERLGFTNKYLEMRLTKD
jgi:ribosomal protein S18 acetylase RimI-like enzyme